MRLNALNRLNTLNSFGAKKAEDSWSSYWAPTSAVVDKDTPKYVVLTYLHPIRSEYADNLLFSIEGKAIKTVLLDETGKILTLEVSVAFVATDEIFVLANNVIIPVINNIPFLVAIFGLGDFSGVSTIRMRVTANVVITLDDTAKFYTDAAGTQNESLTWTITPGALRTIYLKCSSEEGSMAITNVTKITEWGDSEYAGFITSDNSPAISIDVEELKLTQLRIEGLCELNGAMPSGLLYLRLEGEVYWSYEGALPIGLIVLYLNGNNITWTFEGELPAGLLYLVLIGDGINWGNETSLPTGLTLIYLHGENLWWMGLSVGEMGNITNLTLSKYRVGYLMDSAAMITLLTQLTNRVGSLPSEITINNYIDYASPPSGVVDAVNALKVAKSVTTVNLGG